jgi:ribosomal protein S18 acetylase RimI-like enzyme
LKVISHTNPEIASYRDEISDHVANYESMGMNYWLFIEESNPVAVYFIGNEPVNLIAPLGTPVSMIQILNYDIASNSLTEAASEAMRMCKKRGVKYFLAPSIPMERKEIIDAFRNLGFQQQARWYRMTHALQNLASGTELLRFAKIERENLREFIEWMSHCMTGSQGESEDVTLSNLAEVPDQLLDFWYSMQELYNVYRDSELLGIVNLTPASDTNFNNVGVTPEHRGKGYGRQITIQALTRLRELDIKEARLRVYAENQPAIGLYESLGFKVEKETIDLILWFDEIV